MCTRRRVRSTDRARLSLISWLRSGCRDRGHRSRHQIQTNRTWSSPSTLFRRTRSFDCKDTRNGKNCAFFSLPEVPVLPATLGKLFIRRGTALKALGSGSVGLWSQCPMTLGAPALDAMVLLFPQAHQGRSKGSHSPAMAGPVLGKKEQKKF